MKTEKDVVRRISGIIEELYFNTEIRRDNGYKILIDDADFSEIRTLLWVLKDSEEEE